MMNTNRRGDDDENDDGDDFAFLRSQTLTAPVATLLGRNCTYTWTTPQSCPSSGGGHDHPFSTIDYDSVAWHRSSLILDGGPLSPQALLQRQLRVDNNDDLPHFSPHSECQQEEETRSLVEKILNEKPDDCMLQASQQLYVAAIEAKKDMHQLLFLQTIDDDDDNDNEKSSDPTTQQPSREHIHSLFPEKIESALRLILQDIRRLPNKIGNLGHKSSNSIHIETMTTTKSTLNHFSAIQLLLAQLDAILESMAPCLVRESGEKKKWRIRDLLHALRPKLGLPMSLLLHLLVGPLNGVCLRNLVWHGYVGLADVEQWACLLWIIVAFGFDHSGAATADDATTAVDPNSEPVTDKVPSLPQKQLQMMMQDSIDQSILPDESDMLRLFSITATNIFLPHWMRPVLVEALRLCRQHCNQHSQKSCQQQHHCHHKEHGLLWRALALLYIILEAGLRRLFGRENGDEDISLARTDKLHVTMSTLLRSSVRLNSVKDEEKKVGQDGDDLSFKSPFENTNVVLCPSTSPNKLLKYLGESPVDALFDEFVWTGSSDPTDEIKDEVDNMDQLDMHPPCRNELVHGVLALDKVHPQVVNRLIVLVLGISAITVQRNDPASMPLLDSCTQKCLDLLVSYKSRNHPACKIWWRFSGVILGNLSSSHKNDDRERRLVETLLHIKEEIKTTHKEIFDEPKMSTALPSRRKVEYCPICTLPPEYCCYTTTAAKCLEYRFELSSSGDCPNVSLETANRLARMLAVRFQQQSDLYGSAEADEIVLASELEFVRQELMAATQVLFGENQPKVDNKDDGTNRANSNGGSMTKMWPTILLQQDPPRRTAPEDQLNLLWVIRETIVRCAPILQQVYRRLLQVLAWASTGKTFIEASSGKKDFVASIVHKLQVTLQTTEILLLISFQQYLLATDTKASLSSSLVLVSFASVVANTLANHLEQGRLRWCVSLGAGLSLVKKKKKSNHDCPTTTMRTTAWSIRQKFVDKLPAADRGKFVLDMDKYLAHVQGVATFADTEMITNKFVLGNATVAVTTSSAVADKNDNDDDDDDDSTTTQQQHGVAWASLRRW